MEASGNMSLEINNTVDNSWRLMTSHVPMNSSEPRNSSLFPSNSRQLETFQDIEPLNVDAAMPKQEQYRCFFGKDLGSLESPKEEHQLLQPLFDPWPKMRDLGSHIDDHRSNKNLVTATQLSMSSPTASNLFARSAQSPNGMCTFYFFSSLINHGLGNTLFPFLFSGKKTVQKNSGKKRK